MQFSKNKLVGLNGLEPSTSRLSGVRSNQLSYRPACALFFVPSKLNKEFGTAGTDPAFTCKLHRVSGSVICRVSIERR